MKNKLDEVIAQTAYILDSLRALRNIYDSGDCNTCQNRNCGYIPRVGQLVRYKEAAMYLQAHCNPDMDNKTEWEKATLLAIQALKREADVEEKTAWFNEVLESGYYKDSMRNPALEEEAKSSAIKECQPPTDDWEKYADRLYDLAYQHGKKDAMDPCEDAISRKDAFDIVGRMLGDHPFGGYEDEQLLLRAILDLPSVRPARPTGKWIKLNMYSGMPDHRCSICKSETYVPTCIGEPLYTFCPHCGCQMDADMRESEE